MRILHIEPDEEQHIRLCRAFSAEGIRFIRAASAIEALETLLDDVPDIVVCSTNLPDISGLSLLENIRATKGLPCSNLPFIMTYSRIEGNEWMQAIRMDVEHFLPKHCDVAVFRSAIHQSLSPEHSLGGAQLIH